MVEVCGDGDALRQHIRGIESDAQCIGAGCRLSVAGFDTSYQRLIVVEGYLGVEGEVVGYALLLTFHFQYGI